MSESELHRCIIASLMERLGIAYVEFTPVDLDRHFDKAFFGYDTWDGKVSVTITK